MMRRTLTQLFALELDGLADGLERQLMQLGIGALSFAERSSLLVNEEASWRDDRRCAPLLKQTRLKYSQAAIEDLDNCAGRY